MVILVVLGILLTCYVIYYRRYVVCRPELVCCDPERRRTLEENCPALFQDFYPTIWAPQGHMQTLIRAVCQSFPKHKRRRCVKLMSCHTPSSFIVCVCVGRQCG